MGRSSGRYTRARRADCQLPMTIHPTMLDVSSKVIYLHLPHTYDTMRLCNAWCAVDRSVCIVESVAKRAATLTVRANIPQYPSFSLPPLIAVVNARSPERVLNELNIGMYKLSSVYMSLSSYIYVYVTCLLLR